jgi:hypothetical protein
VRSFFSTTPVCWKEIEIKLRQAASLLVWQIDVAESQALANRAAQLPVTMQDCTE